MLQSFVNSLAIFLPKLIGAIILIAIGWIIGFFVGKAIKKVLTAYNIDERITGDKTPPIQLSSLIPKIFS
ncbi:mechanosensitive ion channel family protein [[Eubacterium] cellulosolvens]